MKKLANIVNQRARRDESEQFVLLTEQTIDDWVHDSNEKVVTMGEKLRYILSRRYNGNNSNNSNNNNNHSNNRTNNKPRNNRNPRNNRRDKRY